jgi:enamine deaminase RidA (YjgF/YER057c/UK114 family)
MAKLDDRQRVPSNSPYEHTIGFSRAVRVGARVLVSGTGPIRADGGLDEGVAEQAHCCLELIEAALAEAGAGLADVVRTRMYVVDPADIDVVGRTHASYFADVRPAATMVVVKALVDPRWRVEIEAEAIIGS